MIHSPNSNFSVPKDGPDTVYRLAAPAVPFFSSDSAVHDLYKGELTPVAGLIRDHTFVFIMYYSSWSAACLSARSEFEKAAQIMKTRVKQLAILFHPHLYMYISVSQRVRIIFRSHLWQLTAGTKEASADQSISFTTIPVSMSMYVAWIKDLSTQVKLCCCHYRVLLFMLVGRGSMS